MPYGTIKIDTVTFTNAGVDKSVTLSGLVQNPTFSGNVTVTGTLSGVTVTGTTANFTSGNFTNISGGTHTITSGVFASGSAASPSITFTGDLNTGIYSPGADQVAISSNGVGRLFIDSSGNVGLVSAPSAFGTRTAIQLNGAVSNWFAGGVNGLTLFSRNLYNDGGNKFIGSSYASSYYQSTSGDHVFEYSSASGTAGAAATMLEAMRITNAGRLGLGTSSPGQALDVKGIVRSSIGTGTGAGGAGYAFYQFGTSATATENWHIGAEGDGSFRFYNQSVGAGVERVRITSAGNVGIGTTAPGSQLQITSNAAVTIGLEDTRTPNTTGKFSNSNGTVIIDAQFNNGNGIIRFTGNSSATDYGRFDTSGRFLVGTSSSVNTTALGNAQVQVVGSTNETAQLAISRFSNDADRGRLTFIKSRGSSGTNTIVQADDAIGRIEFLAADGSASTAYPVAAHIGVFVDGTPGANNMPGRIVLSTTASGASSPTERMRIKSNGTINFSNVATYADNAAATTGGLAVGDVYRTSTGQLMIRY